MADINEILGRQINSVKELKTAISELQNSLIGVDTESEQYKTTSQQLAAAQAELTKVTRAGKEENNAAADSIRGMEKEYKALYDQYKVLTEEQRNSDIGKNMAASLETLSNKLNETKKEVGNFKDNIGRYAESAGEAFNGMGLSIGGLQTPLKLATGGAKTFGTALKSLAANPIVLVITALVAILAKAAEAIKKNEQLSNRLNQALAALKPVTDALANVFDFLAGMIVKAVEGMSKAVEWISKINPKWNAAVKSHKDLAKATNDLTKAQRENSVVASQKTAEIERLRQEASATDDVVEKKRLLEEAKKMQQEVDQREIELAQEELRILQEYAEKTANAAEDNDKLAAAQKKVNDAIAKGEQNMRQYNKQINTVDNSVKKTTTSTKNYREEAKKLHEQLIEDNKDEITKITEKYEKEKKLLTKYGYDTTLLTQKYEKDVYKVRKEASERLKSENLNITAQTIQQLRQIYQKESPIDFLEDEIKNYREKVIPVLRSLKREGAAVQEAYGKIDSLLVKDGSTIKSSLREILDLITNRGDFAKGTSFDYIFQQLDDLATTQPQFKNAVERIKADLNEIGPEKFAAITGELKISADYLKDYFGIVVQNTQQAGNQIVIAKEKITELRGQISQLKIETSAATETKNLFTELLSMPDELFNYEDIVKYQEEGERKILEAQKKAYEKELGDFKGTQDQKLEMLQQYYDVVMKLRKMDWEAAQALSDLQKERLAEMIESLIDMTDKTAAAMSTYRSTQEAVIDSQVRIGEIDEKEANKRKERLLDLQAAETAFSIATITADAASGIFNVWKGYASEVGVINPETAAATGPGAAAALAGLNAKSLVTAIAKTASLASTAAAQIAAARGGYVSAKNNFYADVAEASSTGVAATPNLVDSTPYSYTKTVQTQEEEDMLNAPIYVTVTDIEEGLGQRVRVTNESSF